MNEVNKMCEDCKYYKAGCAGTSNGVWTGCIFKVSKSIQVKSHFGGWHDVSKEQATRFVLHILQHANALKKPIEYIESNRLRGCTVAELFNMEV